MSMMSLYDSLLMKAAIDRSKLVQVQRLVNRQGKSFMQNFWVSPDQVKKTDVVIGNAQLLAPDPILKTPPPKGVLDMKYYNALCKTKDHDKVVAYIQSCGIPFKTASNKGITLMRAKQALNQFVQANPIYMTTPGKPNFKTQTTITPATNPQITQPQGAPALNSITVPLPITPAQQAQIDACKNGKEKAQLARKMLGNTNFIAWAQSNGLTWNTNPHPAINLMRCGEAVKNFFDNVDGTQTPMPVPKGKAPKMNAPSDKSKDNKPKASAPIKPKADPAALKVLDSHTPRQRAFIEHINKLTNPQDIRRFALLGVIPEDKESAEFLLKKSFPTYDKWARGKGGEVTIQWKKDHDNMLPTNSTDGTLLGIKLTGNSTSKILGKAGVTMTPRKALVEAFENTVGYYNSNCDINELTNPYASSLERMKTGSIYIGAKLNTLNGQMKTLNDTYSTYAKDTEQGVLDNMGYSYADPEKHASEYTIENEGFVRAIRHIQKNNPDTTAAGDEMIMLYQQNLDMAKGDRVLFSMLGSNTVIASEHDDWAYGVRDKPMSQKITTLWSNDWKHVCPSPKYAKQMLEQLDTVSDKVIAKLEQRGLSPTAIVHTLKDNYHNTDTKWSLYDDDGHIVDTCDMTSVLGSVGITQINSTMLRQIQYQYYEKRIKGNKDVEDNLNKNFVFPINSKKYELEVAKRYRLEAISKLTQRDLVQFRLNTLKMQGMHYADKQGKELTTDEVVAMIDTLNKGEYKSNPLAGMLQNAAIVQSMDNEHRTLAANLMQMTALTSLNNEVSDQLDKQGKNPGGTGTWSWYTTTTTMSYERERRPQFSLRYYKSSATSDEVFTRASEIHEQLDKQLADMPVLSTKTMDELDQMDVWVSKLPTTVIGATSHDITLNDVYETPAKDLFFNAIKNLYTYASHGKTPIEKKLDYMPFDSTQTNQPRFADKGKSNASKEKAEAEYLKKSRQLLFDHANATLAIEDEATSEKLRKEMLDKWDYKKGDKTPDGEVIDGPLHSGWKSKDGNQQPFFNSRFFKVKNSGFEERFNKTLEEYYYNNGFKPEVINGFHGTNYGSISGVIGRSDGFYMKGEVVDTGTMLGTGAYIGARGGKSSVYVGNDSYANRKWVTGNDYQDCKPGEADGVMVMVSAVRGDNALIVGEGGAEFSTYDRNGNKWSSVSCDANMNLQGQRNPYSNPTSHMRKGLKDWEMCVKSNDLLFPHHFVDMSSRCVGRNIDDAHNGTFIDRVNGTKYDETTHMIINE